MSVESTRHVIEKYLGSDHAGAEQLASDVVFTIMGTGQEHKGPDAVTGMLHYFYQNAFEARAEQRNLIVGENQAVLEFDFVGKHTGEFAGIPATGKNVRVPTCVVYDVEANKITRARVYMEMPVMLQQLGVQPK